MKDYFLEDEDIIIDINENNYKKNNYVFKEREIKESFSLLDLLSEEDKQKLKEVLNA